MSEPSELEYAWSIAEARNERLCQVLLDDNLALLARVAKLKTALKEARDVVERANEERWAGAFGALHSIDAALKDAPQ